MPCMSLFTGTNTIHPSRFVSKTISFMKPPCFSWPDIMYPFSLQFSLGLSKVILYLAVQLGLCMYLLSWDPGEQDLPPMNVCLAGSSMKPGTRKVFSTMDWMTVVFWVESVHYLAWIYRLFFGLGKFITLSIVFHTSGLSTLILYSVSSSGRCFSHKSIRLFTRKPRKCHLLCQCKIWLCLITHLHLFCAWWH